MSLINEALKKAQAERPSPPNKEAAMREMPTGQPPRPPKKKRYLFSFIISVLVVALFSTAISSFLIYQILGDDKPDNEQPDTVMETITAPEPEGAEPVNPEPEPEPVSEAVEKPAVVEPVTPDSLTDETALSEKVDDIQPTDDPEPISSPPAVVVEAEPESIAEEPVMTIAPRNTHPEVWNRLNDFEIRGIMSGGSKVLIYDANTKKARAYTPGDLIDGALSLEILTIENNSINFKTHDGTIFPKAF